MSHVVMGEISTGGFFILFTSTMSQMVGEPFILYKGLGPLLKFCLVKIFHLYLFF